jgi:hypothetical protein
MLAEYTQTLTTLMLNGCVLEKGGKQEVLMSKYEPLVKYLRSQNRAHVPMTFREIEQILGRSLPPSKKHRAWWSNNSSNNVMTRQWLAAGYETASVDVVSERLVFRRSSEKLRGTEADSAKGGDQDDQDDLNDPIFGCMKGTMTIPADLDLTAPADPEWGKVYEDG